MSKPTILPTPALKYRKANNNPGGLVLVQACQALQDALMGFPIPFVRCDGTPTGKVLKHWDGIHVSPDGTEIATAIAYDGAYDVEDAKPHPKGTTGVPPGQVKRLDAAERGQAEAHRVAAAPLNWDSEPKPIVKTTG
jgi:hypothetical protein